MTNRERYHRVLHYEDVDYVPFRMVGIWGETLQRWYGEGLPRDVDLRTFLEVPDFEIRNISGNTEMYPWFETRTLSEDDEFIVRTDEWGRTVRDMKHHSVIPEWIDFPVKNGSDLENIIDERFSVEALDDRYPGNWEAEARMAAESDAILLVNAGWYYWTLRQLSGVERASYLLYDAPEVVEELFERINIVALDCMRRVFEITRVDGICFGEDIAFKTGPLMSPEMNRRFLIPRYKKIMDLALENDCDIAWFGSDGDLRLLIPDLLSVGVNAMEPCEVAASMVPNDLRTQFGRDLLIIGGIDKREIAKGPEAIRAEIDARRPVIEEGGFLPSIDHSVPADISFENYRYYVEYMKRALGMI